MFELLPNEILIECFEYLHGADIYYSFDGLNSRINNLIQKFTLNLNLQYIRKTLFDQVCTKMKLNPAFRKKILSLKLSNKDTCDQIDVFLSLFSLDEFSNLQSLTLTQVRYKNMEKLKPMLSLIPNLCSFGSIDYKYELPTILLSSKLRTLVVHKISHLNNTDETFSIVNLTIASCSLNDLHQLFKKTPLLKYLTIHIILSDLHSLTINNTNYSPHYAINLQEIIIKDFQEEFQNFKIFVEQAPNLKSLTIFSNNKTMIDAYGWQDLITTSLPHLEIFKFKLGCDYENDKNVIVEKFKQFQNDFWQQEHRWYTEYVLDMSSAFIYTIPYMSNTFTLTNYMDRFYNEPIDNCNIFNKVTNLIIDRKAIRENCQFYFSNVKSLELKEGSDKLYDDEHLQVEHVQFLKMIIKLSNLKHLNIVPKFRIDMSLVLLEILKQSPQLSSLTLDPFALKIILYDDELCGYLKSMIKNLDIYLKNDDTLDNFDIIEKLCQVFSNLEQLKCNMKQLDHLVFLLNHLSKLSFLNVMVTYSRQNFIDRFVNEVSKFEATTYDIDYKDSNHKAYKAEICLWIRRNID